MKRFVKRKNSAQAQARLTVNWFCLGCALYASNVQQALGYTETLRTSGKRVVLRRAGPARTPMTHSLHINVSLILLCKD